MRDLFNKDNFSLNNQLMQNTDKNKNNDEQFILKDLDDFMEGELENEITDIDENTKIDDYKANIFLKLYLNLEEEKNSIDKICDREIKRATASIEEYKNKMHEEIEKKQSFFRIILKKFLEEKLQDRKTKSKTVKLPYGNLSVRKNAPKIIYENEDGIMEFLKNNASDLILTKKIESIDKKNLKAKTVVDGNNLSINGKIIPYIKIEEQEDKFEIKSNK